jgi:hypothetical protein
MSVAHPLSFARTMASLPLFAGRSGDIHSRVSSRLNPPRSLAFSLRYVCDAISGASSSARAIRSAVLRSKGAAEGGMAPQYDATLNGALNRLGQLPPPQFEGHLFAGVAHQSRALSPFHWLHLART